MPAPTAIQRAPEALAEDVATQTSLHASTTESTADATTEEVIIDSSIVPTQISVVPSSNDDTVMQVDEEGRPHFPPAKEVVRVVVCNSLNSKAILR